MRFDAYVQVFGKISAVISAVCVLITLLVPCGALFGGLLFIPHSLVFITALCLPLLWHWLKKERAPLSSYAQRWAWIALAAVVASLPLMVLFDHSGKQGCFR